MTKRNFNRILALGLTAIIGLSAVACRSTEDEVEETTAASTTTETTTEATTTTTTVEETTTTETTTEAELVDSPNAYPLTGIDAGFNVEETELPILAIMIDNHPDARPQYGVSQADIVIEQRVEGPYTRYLALFQSQEPSKIGPVRSSRFNFLQKLAGIDAIYFHVGGSEEALNYIANNNWVTNVDAMSASTRYLWRDSAGGKFAPHNVFTSYDAATTAITNYGYSLDSQAPELQFYANLSLPGYESSTANSISVTYDASNISEYEYDAGDGKYLRSKNGEQQVDEGNGQVVSPSNVIVQFVRHSKNGIYQVLDQIGTGNAYLFTAGQKVDITWSKPDLHSPTKFYYAGTEEEIVLNPGLTWIETIEGPSSVKFN